jgi:signal peptidase I
VRRVGLILLFGGGAVVALLIVSFVLLGAVYRAPSESMVPTIKAGDRFAVLKVGTPKLGDIVVHYPPAGAETGDGCAAKPRAGEMCARSLGGHADVKFVKRIVAVGGDRISMRDGKVVRNGRPETTDGPQACSGRECNFPRTITVPEGTYYMLGDNRGASDDSRFWGPVRTDWVIGRYWFGL